jgi:HAD superfamily hydrolase (TIGR01509 family)
MISLVIFDCDGVLVDSETIANQILVQHLHDALGLDIDEVRSIALFRGKSMAHMTAMLSEMTGQMVGEEFVASLRKIEAVRFTSELKAMPGIEQVLDALDAMGIATCVGSNGPHEKMAVTLGVTGLKARFDGRIFSALDVARSKPAPDLFLHAAAKMGKRPHDCLVVEDSKLGVEAARSAGMQVFGFDPDSDGAHLAELGAVPFHHMPDLVPMIARLNATG